MYNNNNNNSMPPRQFSNPPNYNPNFFDPTKNNVSTGDHGQNLNREFYQRQKQQQVPPQQFFQPQFDEDVRQRQAPTQQYFQPHFDENVRQRSSQQQMQQQASGSFADSASAATAAAAAAVLSGDANAGARLLETQRNNLAARWMPGFAAVWEQLRSYFAVSHRSVGLKLRALMVPWTKKAWRRQKTTQVDSDVVVYALPVDDANAPDLYLPLVSFVTFALVSAYVRGQSGTFTPEVLAQIISSCAIFQLFELVLYTAGLYVAGAGASLLDLTCYTGYKYVSLCFNMLATLLGGDRAYYAALTWTALSSSYFMLKTMAQTVPTRTSGVGPRREFLVCGLGITQGCSIWLLGFLFKGTS